MPDGFVAGLNRGLAGFSADNRTGLITQDEDELARAKRVSSRESFSQDLHRFFAPRITAVTL